MNKVIDKLVHTKNDYEQRRSVDFYVFNIILIFDDLVEYWYLLLWFFIIIAGGDIISELGRGNLTLLIYIYKNEGKNV